ncbi:hypothetical protein [Streptomyces blattellae]|uniref:hypothetical protein n=1 Tax=Streptomyces blattellae TaxID=2569855 RepID=UPI0012B7BD8C|nr:hypothetical protein [Streptomyces blattellae]
MHEPIDAAYMKETQRLIQAAPKGPWKVEPTDDGRLPDQVGPICFLETWVDSERIGVVEFISHAREALPRYMGAAARQQDEIERLRAEVGVARRFAEGMRNLGVSVHYANQLIEAMDQAKGGGRRG